MSEDICRMIIRYGQSKIIGNEQQFLAVVLSATTCYAVHDQEKVSCIIVGESSGGKTHVQREAVNLLPQEHVKKITSGSEKAPIYNEDLRDETIRYIMLGELQKLPHAILEYMKSMSGDDDDFNYDVTNASKGNTTTISQIKRAYSVTYAQVEIDRELQTRVFVVPIMENMEINRCVAAIKLGAEQVEYKGRLYDFSVSSTDELRSEIISSISSLQYLNFDVKIPYPFALIDMVNHARADSKRHSQLIANLIKASARLNWKNRSYTDDNRVIASAQDLVNVLSMFDILLATMMGVDIIDLSIYSFLRKSSTGTSDEEIISHIHSAGLTELTKEELNRRLYKLHNENYIIRDTASHGFLWSANPNKQILSVDVKWEDVNEQDPSPVVDPITGDTFRNISEYGHQLRSEYNIDATDDRQKNEQIRDDLSEEEADRRQAVLSTIDEPMTNNDLTTICTNAQRFCNVDSGYFDFHHTIQELENEGLVVKKDTEYYRN